MELIWFRIRSEYKNEISNIHGSSQNVYAKKVTTHKQLLYNKAQFKHKYNGNQCLPLSWYANENVKKERIMYAHALYLFTHINEASTAQENTRLATYITHFKPVMGCPSFQEWPVKEITVICHIDTRFHFLHMRKPCSKKLNLPNNISHKPKKN